MKNILTEPIKNPERFLCKKLDKAYIEQAISKVLKKIDIMMERFGERFPFCASENGKYEVIENIEWTTGFWTGMLHLAYEYTGNEKYRALADKHVLSFKERIEQSIRKQNGKKSRVGSCRFFMYALFKKCRHYSSMGRFKRS